MFAKTSFALRSVALLPLFLIAGAAEPPRELEQLMLMHVDGKLVIETDGRVGALDFDTKFDPALRAALEAKMRAWRFQPVRVAGQAARAQTSFSVGLAAQDIGGRMQVRVDGTQFGQHGNAGEAPAIVPDGVAPPITAKTMTPPRFPMDLMRAGKIGLVRLTIRVAPDGRVAEVVASQALAYDIGGKESEKSARRSIRDFEAASVEAARKWTFNVPAGASARKVEDMTVSGDIEFQLRYDTGLAGQWVPVRRAAARVVAWLPHVLDDGNLLGVGQAGRLAGAESPFKLATPVAGNVVM